MKKISSTQLFWVVYVAFLFVLWPQAAWTIDQFQDVTSTRLQFMGVVASPLAWALAGVMEATIGIVTHRLNEHWRSMPTRYKAADMGRKRFAFRWLNAYALALIVSMAISAVANYTHVVEFTNAELRVFEGRLGLVQIYQITFGLALPAVSFVFARVLSTMQDAEQEEDPAFAKAKTELRDARETIRSLEQTIRQSEQAIRSLEMQLDESEQRYRAVGDVVRWLFGKDENLRDRIRGIRMAFPSLSQNGIAQIVGCAVSTVNEALQGFAAGQQILIAQEVDN